MRNNVDVLKTSYTIEQYIQQIEINNHLDYDLYLELCRWNLNEPGDDMKIGVASAPYWASSVIGHVQSSLIWNFSTSTIWKRQTHNAETAKMKEEESSRMHAVMGNYWSYFPSWCPLFSDYKERLQVSQPIWKRSRASKTVFPISNHFSTTESIKLVSPSLHLQTAWLHYIEEQGQVRSNCGEAGAWTTIVLYFEYRKNRNHNKLGKFLFCSVGRHTLAKCIERWYSSRILISQREPALLTSKPEIKKTL